MTERRIFLPTVPFGVMHTPREMLNLHISDEINQHIDTLGIPHNIATSVIATNIRRRYEESAATFSKIRDNQDFFTLRDRKDYDHYARLRMLESDPDHAMSMRDKARLFVEGHYMSAYEVCSTVENQGAYITDPRFAIECLRKISHVTASRHEIHTVESLPKVQRIIPNPLGRFAVIVTKRTNGMLDNGDVDISLKSRTAGILNIDTLRDEGARHAVVRLGEQPHDVSKREELEGARQTLLSFIYGDEGHRITPLIESIYLAREDQ